MRKEWRKNISSSSNELPWVLFEKISLSCRCECLSRDSARHFPWNGRKLLRGGSYPAGLVREAKLICCVRVVAGLELEVGWHRVEADGKFRGVEGRVIWFRVVGEPNSEWPVKMPPHAPFPLHTPFHRFPSLSLSASLSSLFFPFISLLFRTLYPHQAHLRGAGRTVNWGKRLLVLSREEDGDSLETRGYVRVCGWARSCGWAPFLTHVCAGAWVWGRRKCLNEEKLSVTDTFLQIPSVFLRIREIYLFIFYDEEWQWNF